MRTMTLNSSLAVGTLIMMAGLAALPVKAAVKYTWTPGSLQGSGDSNFSVGTASDTTITYTATGWSNTITDGTSNTNPDDNKLQRGTLGRWNGTNGYGMGVYNQDASGTTGCPNTGGNSDSIDNCEDVSPEHAVDSNGRYDSILYSFTDSIKLTEVSLSYFNTDSDITVMAYTGTLDTSTSLENKSYDQLIAAGWKFVGHYTDLAGDANNYKSINDGGQSVGNAIYTASSWLIGAYNPLVGGDQGIGKGNDYVKIANLKGEKYTPPQQDVPEPGSLAILGLGGLLLVRARNRRG